MTISRIYEIGKRSLLAYQSAIHTTTGNISNMNNENYTRRRVDLSGLSTHFSGLGINLADSIRMRQKFAEHQIWLENQNLGKYESFEMILGQVENIFAEDTEAGLTNVLSEFWNAWNDLANDPESEFAHTLVRDKGNILTNTFQRVHTDLKNLQDQLLPEIQSQVVEVHQKLNHINDVNHAIRTRPSSDLFDERDRLLTELSKTINIKVKEKDNGEASVFVEGLILVSEGVVNELDTNLVTNNGYTEIQIQYKKGNKILEVKSGEIAGMLENHNQRIPEYLNKLDELAVSIAQNVNSVHSTGFNLAGVTNIDFFDATVSGAADFKVNDAVNLDPSLIATRAAGEGEGSGSIAQAVSDLQYQSIVNSSTAANFYNTMLTDIGNTLQETDFLRHSQELILQQLYNQRDEIAGVSLDEEMTKMMQFEQAYEAAARVVTTVDEMVQTLLAMK